MSNNRSKLQRNAEYVHKKLTLVDDSSESTSSIIIAFDIEPRG